MFIHDSALLSWVAYTMQARLSIVYTLGEEPSFNSWLYPGAKVNIQSGLYF